MDEGARALLNRLSREAHELAMLAADIAANGQATASQRYAGFQAKHDTNPQPGDLLCPITGTKANPRCSWVINGAEYFFCCPPCIDEFVRLAKQGQSLPSPDRLVKN